MCSRKWASPGASSGSHYIGIWVVIRELCYENSIILPLIQREHHNKPQISECLDQWRVEQIIRLQGLYAYYRTAYTFRIVVDVCMCICSIYIVEDKWFWNKIPVASLIIKWLLHTFEWLRHDKTFLLISPLWLVFGRLWAFILHPTAANRSSSVRPPEIRLLHSSFPSLLFIRLTLS